MPGSLAEALDALAIDHEFLTEGGVFSDELIRTWIDWKRENEASLALHRKTGFRVVGTQERLGKLDGVWRDVVVLERRSKEIS